MRPPCVHYPAECCPKLPLHRTSNNWLVHRICLEYLSDAAAKYAKGTLVDVGCGEKPYAPLFSQYVERHIGVDHADTQHSLGEVDVVAGAYDTTLSDAFADTVLCSAVLEHLESPLDALRETHRILKPNGHLILTAPLFWHLHEEPRDFFRYTSHGLEYLVKTAGLEVVEIRPMSGFAVTFAQEFCYLLGRFRRIRLMRVPVTLLAYLIQRIAYSLRRWDNATSFTWMYLVIAKKPKVHPVSLETE